MHLYRDHVPVRSGVAHRNNYREYKASLRSDFLERCGYCDAQDEYFGGVTGAHIDHFAPKKKFPALKEEYTNLVYTCGFCNRAKSDKWIGNDPTVPNNGRQGFVDPCSSDYDEHLARSRSGEIVPTSVLGEYQVDNLNFRLMRHKFIWQAQKLDALAEKMEELRVRIERAHPQYVELLENVVNVMALYRVYRRKANAP